MFSIARTSKQAMVLTAMSALLPCAVHAAIVEGEQLVDPTAPLNYSLPEAQMGTAAVSSMQPAVMSYKLSSVLVRSGDRIAVINDQRVREGETVDGARVIDISSSGVTLEVDGVTRVLQLYQGSIKSRAESEG